jgi:hypothetical protein
MYADTIGALVVTYLSGKDADASTPVFDMTLGEITLENTGDRAINLQYDGSHMRYLGHRFTFGPHALDAPADDKPNPHEFPPAPMNYDLAPGQKVLVCRRDFMDFVRRNGVGVLQDGEVCTRFGAALVVDGVPHVLRFGPHCFRVALERDWQQEKERFVEFFLDREGWK